MRFLSALAAGWLLNCAPATADIIKCSFTEPFVTTTYSTTTNTLEINYDVEKRSETLSNVSFQIKAAGEFELWDAQHRPIQLLKLTGAGTDGMSDKKFPYEVEWLLDEKKFGGCTSNHLPSSN